MFDLAEIQACPVRFEILVNIAKAPVHVSALTDRLELDIESVSFHLAKLATAGLVVYVRQGRFHIYSLGPAATASFTEQGLILTMRSDDGQSNQWTLNAAQVAEFLRTPKGPAGAIGRRMD